MLSECTPHNTQQIRTNPFALIRGIGVRLLLLKHQAVHHACLDIRAAHQRRLINGRIDERLASGFMHRHVTQPQLSTLQLVPGRPGRRRRQHDEYTTYARRAAQAESSNFKTGFRVQKEGESHVNQMLLYFYARAIQIQIRTHLNK